MDELVAALDADFEGSEPLRQRLLNRSPKWGNDDAAADEVMQRVFGAFVDAIDGRPNGRGGTYGVDMLPTTCHVYFGGVTGATPDGRRAYDAALGGHLARPGRGPARAHGRPAVRRQDGPGADLRHAAQHEGQPGADRGRGGDRPARGLVRTYFGLGGHHIQFNVVSIDTLREAQASPDAHRDLIVRVAGYSDYFCDLSRELQDEIIARTEHEAL